jgi:hypothetical protein
MTYLPVGTPPTTDEFLKTISTAFQFRFLHLKWIPKFGPAAKVV